jgi:rare lipoprotein A (peptidoglycan hydrolase)
MNNKLWTGFTLASAASVFSNMPSLQATTIDTTITEANTNQQEVFDNKIITPLIITELKTEVAVPDPTSVVFKDQPINPSAIPVLKFVPAESLMVNITPEQIIANAAPRMKSIAQSKVARVNNPNNLNRFNNLSTVSKIKPFKVASQEFAPIAPVNPANTTNITPVTNTSPTTGVLLSQVGKASFYGLEGGRVTANGERYNPSSLTAAHRTLPFGSMVRVTNLRNNKSVVVRINNRGPFIAGRIIDLSTGAARAIGLTSQGVGNVRLEVLSYGSGKRVNTPRKVRTNRNRR